jgi:hypothetical protein
MAEGGGVESSAGKNPSIKARCKSWRDCQHCAWVYGCDVERLFRQVQRLRAFVAFTMPSEFGDFGVGGIIVAEAALSFLGLGARPPAPSWGNMLEAGRQFLLVAPRLTAAPGVAIGLSVLGFNLLGDGLAHAIHRRN